MTRDEQDRNEEGAVELGAGGQDDEDVTTGGPRMVDAQDDAEDQARADRARAAEAGDPRAEAEQADARANRDAGSRKVARSGRIVHAAEWLDGKLVRRLGGADLGPYDVESDESVRTHDACPLCGHPMGEHQIDRSHPNAVLICPAERIPPVEHNEPLNEVGMPKRSTQGES